MTTAIKIEKLTRVENTDKKMLNKGIVAFQMVKFTYFFYGSLQSEILDTKIMKDGSQIVIDGNGFIKSGSKI
jgi:hypothetical protein